MSLATRCSQCGTTFRVVQDQLKVSEGWVRCGKCEAVFNAVEGLFDLERDAPELPRSATPPAGAATTPPSSASLPLAPSTPTSASPSASPAPAAPRAAKRANPSARLGPAAPAAARAASAPMPMPMPTSTSTPTRTPTPTPAPTPTPTTRPPVDAFVASRPPEADPEPDPVATDDPENDAPLRLGKPGPKPAVAVGARDRLEFSDARFDSDLFEENAGLDDEEAGAGAATGAGALPLESERAPDFLRRPERRAGWRPAPSRGLIGGALALAIGGLAAQVAVHHRATIAAAWPWTHGILDAACGVAGCTVEAPRRIEALTVESTALARAVGQDGFVLTVGLRNRGASALVTPSVDLALTDGGGRLVARRALGPAELHAARTIAAGADLQLQTALDVRGTRVAGYTVEIFYP